MLRKEIEKCLAQIEHLLALKRLIHGTEGYQEKVEEYSKKLMTCPD